MNRLLMFSRYLPYQQGQRITLNTLPHTLAILAGFIAAAWANAG